MDVGLPAGVRPPGKGPMRDGEVKVIPVEENWPQEADLLTLRHGVGRNKANAGLPAWLTYAPALMNQAAT